MKVTAATVCTIILLLALPTELQGAPNPYTHERPKSEHHWEQGKVASLVDLRTKIEEISGSNAYLNDALWHQDRAQVEALLAAIQQGGITLQGCGSSFRDLKAMLEQKFTEASIPSHLYSINIKCGDPCTTIELAAMFTPTRISTKFDICTKPTVCVDFIDRGCDYKGSFVLPEKIIIPIGSGVPVEVSLDLVKPCVNADVGAPVCS